MNIKLFNNNLKLNVNDGHGASDWAFNALIKFKNHATNPSNIVLNNLVPKAALNAGHHFNKQTISANMNLSNFKVITLLNGAQNKAIFSGVISSVGRLSLHPNKVKDVSIIVEDLRSWLSRKSPADVTFDDISPTRALNKFINALDEPSIKIGAVNFTDNQNLKAYDTSNKNPYSILKDVIAKQTKSFLYFSTDQIGNNIYINFMSEQDFKNKSSVLISENNWRTYGILDIVINRNTVDYFNKYRVESENVVSNIRSNETFYLGNFVKSVFTQHKIARVDLANCYVKNLLNDSENLPLIIESEKNAKLGKDHHFFYKENENELVFNESWNRDNYLLNFSYYKRSRFSFTVENKQEINRLKDSRYPGDVYKYDKFNDYSDVDDLINFAFKQLQTNSIVRKDITISATKAFLEIGDVVNLNYGVNGIDGKYIVLGYNGTYNSAINDIKIDYNLRNSLNSDTLLNFYDDQNYRDKPFEQNKGERFTAINIDLNGLIYYITTTGVIKMRLNKNSDDYVQMGKLGSTAELMYSHIKTISLVKQAKIIASARLYESVIELTGNKKRALRS